MEVGVAARVSRSVVVPLVGYKGKKRGEEGSHIGTPSLPAWGLSSGLLRMALRLSEGAIAAIMQGEQPVKPILQLINIRPISAGSGPTRYRLLMSDGVNTLSSFLLATQLYSLVDNKCLAANAICKINHHIVNTVKDGRMVIILKDLDVIRSADAMATKIGNPVPYAGGSAGQGGKLTQAATGPTTNQTGSSAGNMPKYFCPPKMPGIFCGPSLPATPGGTQPTVVPIASLHPCQSRWVICARVTQKGQIRTWSNSHGEGKLFSIQMVDESGEIRAIAFHEQVDKFFPLIEMNKVYYFSKGTLRTANKQYSAVKNDYEITFNNDTFVIRQTRKGTLDADHLPSVQFNFVPIGDLEEAKTESVVDILGVCTSYEEATKITMKSSNREVTKRDIHLLDTSGKTVTVTLWANEAEKFDGSQQPVVAIKGAKVLDFGGRSLIVLMSSTLTVNPDRPEAFKLKAWYDREGHHLESSSISKAPGASTTGGYINWKSLFEAKTENLGQRDKADYYSCVGTVVHIRKENCMYKACPSQDCNKKLIDEQNRLYRCEKCDREFPNFKYCIILGVNIADFQDTQWVTCFKQAAETILGHDAAYLGELREKDDLAFEEVLEKANFTTYEFRIRVKKETFNDQTQLKATAVDVRPVDHREHCRRLITSIRKNATELD